MKTEIVTALSKAEPKFAKANDFALVNWSQEVGFAKQAMIGNNTLQNCTPVSVGDALVNVASTGLSLNPALKLAYLVPRKGQCCLDISYMGLIKLAVDAGSIRYAKAELVYENDTFEWLGPTEKPIHKGDPFGTYEDRGKLRGAYCVAELVGGGFLCETMSKEEIDKVKATSMARSGPWVDWYGEMVKKTVIKRASKTWPKTERSIRLDRAIHVINQHEGAPLEDNPQNSGKVLISEEQYTALDAALADLEEPREQFLKALGVTALEHLPADQFASAMKLVKEASA